VTVAGYLKRLARQSGLVPGPGIRPPAASADILEVHEEHIVGTGGLVPADTHTDHPAAAFDDPTAAAPLPGRQSSLAPAVPVVSFSSSSADTAGAVARRSHPARAHADDLPAPAATPAEPARPASERTAVFEPPSAAPARAAPAARADRVAAGPTRMTRGFAGPTIPASTAARAAKPSEPPLAAAQAAMQSHERSAPFIMSAPAQPAPRQATPQRRDDRAHLRPSSEPAQTALPSPRRSQAVAAAPSPHGEKPVPRARESGVKVHIGKIDVEIRAPAPKPAPVPLLTAPAAPAPAPASAETPFSAHRHYVRGLG